MPSLLREPLQGSQQGLDLVGLARLAPGGQRLGGRPAMRLQSSKVNGSPSPQPSLALRLSNNLRPLAGGSGGARRLVCLALGCAFSMPFFVSRLLEKRRLPVLAGETIADIDSTANTSLLASASSFLQHIPVRAVLAWKAPRLACVSNAQPSSQSGSCSAGCAWVKEPPIHRRRQSESRCP